MSQPWIARTAQLGAAMLRGVRLIGVILLGSLLSACDGGGGGGGPSAVRITEFTALPAIMCLDGKPIVVIAWNTTGSAVAIELRDAGGRTLETIGTFGSRGHHDLPVGDLNPGQYWLSLRATASGLPDAAEKSTMITIIDGNSFWVPAGYTDRCDNDNCSVFGPVTDSMPSSLFSSGVRLLQVGLRGWGANSTLDTYLTSVVVTHGSTVIVCLGKDQCGKLPKVQVPDAFGNPAHGDYEWYAEFGHESTAPADVNVMKGTTLGMDVAYEFACEP